LTGIRGGVSFKIRLLYYLPMEMTKKEEKKSELEERKRVAELMNKL
jgi:hypothetical protein